jgi:hypothetical protein
VTTLALIEQPAEADGYLSVAYEMAEDALNHGETLGAVYERWKVERGVEQADLALNTIFAVMLMQHLNHSDDSRLTERGNE